MSWKGNTEPFPVGTRVYVSETIHRPGQADLVWRRKSTLVSYRHDKFRLVRSFFVVKIDGIMGEHEYLMNGGRVEPMGVVDRLAELAG